MQKLLFGSLVFLFMMLSESPASTTGIYHYELNINLAGCFQNNLPQFSAHEKIYYRTVSPYPSQLTFDCVQLTIDSVKIGSTRKNDSTTLANIIIPVSSADFQTDTTVINIWYRYVGTGTRGFYYYSEEAGATLAPLVYTMSEPTDAPYWFVTVNDNKVKPSLNTNITVPVGYQAASNGLLMNTVANANSTVTFQWQETHPIAMYLICFTCSQYREFSAYYHRVTNPADSIEIKYYIWNDDYDSPLTDQITHSAVKCFVNVPRMLEFYSRTYGEYPFDKYGMAAVYPFAFGGMEHQTMTTIHRHWLEVQKGLAERGFDEDAIAHELSHHWFGDLITCETWNDIWLNESFATYSEVLWEEFLNGQQGKLVRLQRGMNFSNPNWQYTVYAPQGYIFGDEVYNKGGWVLHMLRSYIGDSSFFRSLRSYVADSTYRYKTARTDQFTALVQKISGKNLTKFFDQWLNHVGWPVYEYSSRQTPVGSDYLITIHLEQVQNDPTKSGDIPRDGTIYEMPVEFRFYSGASDTTITFMNSKEEDVFSVSLPYKIDSVAFDPDLKILKQLYNVNIVTNAGQFVVPVPSSYKLYQNYPNPFNPSTIVKYDLPVAGNVRIEVLDVLGRVVATIIDEFRLPGSFLLTWDGHDYRGSALPSGVYFMRMKSNTYSSVRKIMILR